DAGLKPGLAVDAEAHRSSKPAERGNRYREGRRLAWADLLRRRAHGDVEVRGRGQDGDGAGRWARIRVALRVDLGQRDRVDPRGAESDDAGRLCGGGRRRSSRKDPGVFRGAVAGAEVDRAAGRDGD